MKNRAFTLIELLVVVLIIGILAAIAVPQYQKSVAKADMYKGVSLTESIYQAQLSYFLAHGEFAVDIDSLDLTVPKDSDCQKIQQTGVSRYKCSYGVIGMFDGITNVQFQTKNGNLGYLHYLKDYTANGVNFKSGERYCYADSAVAGEVCEILGGIKVHDGNSSWKFGLFKI